jgi:catechol 2,3-dioxygenase-like lactoylglutathione lyase family enzyme
MSEHTEGVPMSLPNMSATKLTPNLLVSNVEQSLEFYEDVLGFRRGMTVPEQSPFVFASVTSGPVEIFLNDRSTASRESPQLQGLAPGGGNTMFIEVNGIDALHDALAPRVRIVMPIVTQWYGIREFAIVDPDGYVMTFAERVGAAS